jgi:hypothetical protein
MGMPPVKSILRITSDFEVHSTDKLPSRWRRFWTKALLGWEWTDEPNVQFLGPNEIIPIKGGRS